jgi:hypothetical protein
MTTHQNITTITAKAMMILILMIFTYSHSDNSNKIYYVGKSNTNNLKENLTKQK